MLKVGRALVDKGVHAFTHIFRLEDLGKQVRFDFQPFCQRSAQTTIDSLLDVPQGDTGSTGNRAPQFFGSRQG